MSKHLNEQIQNLESQLKEEREKNSLLVTELEILSDQLQRMKRYIDLQEIILPYFKELMTATVNDLLIDPNPVSLKCGGDKAGQQHIYPVRVLDILAIASKGKYKEIYLRKDALPKDGGIPKSKLIFSQEGIDFEKLLLMIQRRGNHLLQVHKSWCVNIYHYLFTEKNSFQLKQQYRSEKNTDIHSIPVGSIFNKELYHKRLFEINKLKEQAESSLKIVHDVESFKQKLYDRGLLQ